MELLIPWNCKLQLIIVILSNFDINLRLKTGIELFQFSVTVNHPKHSYFTSSSHLLHLFFSFVSELRSVIILQRADCVLATISLGRCNLNSSAITEIESGLQENKSLCELNLTGSQVCLHTCY